MNEKKSGIAEPGPLPAEVRTVVRVEWAYEHIPHGWYAFHHIDPRQCMPRWCNAGGGVTTGMLTTLPKALDASIRHAEAGIEDAQRHLTNLRKARAAL